MLPGPVLGFAFGTGADAASLLFLIAALIFSVLVLNLGNGRIWPYRLAGIHPAKASNEAEMRDLLKEHSAS